MEEGKVVDLSLPANLSLALEISKRRKAHYEAKTAPRPRRSHWPSDLSSCARQMVYGRVMWDKRPPTNVFLQELFDAGHDVEERVKRGLVNQGFELVASGKAMGKASRMEQFGISGLLDTVMKWQGKYVLIEIKSMNGNKWARLKADDNGIIKVEEFERDVFLRKYLRQIQIYLFAFEIEVGLFVLDDCQNHWKYLPVYLDYDFAESILKTVEKANQHIKTWEGGKEGTLPDRIDYGEECQKCPFAKICLPGMINEGSDIVESQELEEMIRRHEELKPAASEVAALWKNIKQFFEGRERQAIVGNYLVIPKVGTKTVYEIPPEVESQYAKQVPSIRLNIQELGK